MKSTGIVRKVDELGRIVLPIELRRTLEIAERDALEIYVEGSTVILKKYEPACIFCGDAKDVINYQGRRIFTLVSRPRFSRLVPQKPAPAPVRAKKVLDIKKEIWYNTHLVCHIAENRLLHPYIPIVAQSRSDKQ